MSDSAAAGFVRKTGGGKYSVDWRMVAPESLFTTELLLVEIARSSRLAGGRMLDIGCGTKPYAQLFADVVESHIGADVPFSIHSQSAIDVFATAAELPFRSNSFDFILCTEVLEHVPTPARTYGEIARLLKPGGRALITTPFMYRVHEPPYDFYRYTPFSHRLLAEQSGLEVEELRPRGGYFSVLADTLLKGLALAVGGAGSALRKLGIRANLRLHPVTRWSFWALQRPLALLLARERVKADVFTLGYVVIVRKAEKSGKANG